MSFRWAAVTARLQAACFTVYAPPNPLRGLPQDAATLRAFLTQNKGPVILAGHSYGGVVITNAATGDPEVKALVYVDAFIPDQGDTLQSLRAGHLSLLADPGVVTRVIVQAAAAAR